VYCEDIFQEKWTDDYFCVSVNCKALCLIFSESIAVLRNVMLLGITSQGTKKSMKTVSLLSEEKKWWL
jgi:hypothetical protein